MVKYKAVETANRNVVTKTEPLRRYIEDRRKQKENPAPSVQPVRAWAVVDKDGGIDVKYSTYEQNHVEQRIAQLNVLFPECAPHRAIRVEIREVNDE